jgi:[ribosomal protein S5]-alanine N-acetyltransferase
MPKTGPFAICSDRLDLIPMTPAFMRASLKHNIQEAGQHLPLSLPEGWPGEFADVLSLRLKQLEDDPALQPWLLRAMAPRGSGIMVGHIGFHAAPGAEYLRPFSPEAAEFGFTVFPAFRRQGYAREASVALMRWASQAHNVRNFVMSIRPDNLASQALAAQLGFVRIGSHIDEVDGLEDILEYRVSGDDASKPLRSNESTPR